MEDHELIQSILSGQQEDYAHLVRKYQPRVMRLCGSLLTDPILAEDAAQDIFLKAYQALPRFRRDASFSTWLYRIAANHCKDLLRKRAREKTESWDALVEQNGERIEQLLVAPDDQRTAVANAELAHRILCHLPVDYRLILTLREVEGLTYKQLAQTLSCSIDAVKARLRRARHALQERLRHFLGHTAV